MMEWFIDFYEEIYINFLDFIVLLKIYVIIIFCYFLFLYKCYGRLYFIYDMLKFKMFKIEDEVCFYLCWVYYLIIFCLIDDWMFSYDRVVFCFR